MDAGDSGYAESVPNIPNCLAAIADCLDSSDLPDSVLTTASELLAEMSKDPVVVEHGDSLHQWFTGSIGQNGSEPERVFVLVDTGEADSNLPILYWAIMPIETITLANIGTDLIWQRLQPVRLSGAARILINTLEPSGKRPIIRLKPWREYL